MSPNHYSPIQYCQPRHGLEIKLSPCKHSQSVASECCRSYKQFFFLQLIDTAVANPCLLLVNPTFHFQYSRIGDLFPLDFFSLFTTSLKLLISRNNDNCSTLKTLKGSHFASLRRRVNICLLRQAMKHNVQNSGYHLLSTVSTAPQG